MSDMPYADADEEIDANWNWFIIRVENHRALTKQVVSDGCVNYASASWAGSARAGSEAGAADKVCERKEGTSGVDVVQASGVCICRGAYWDKPALGSSRVPPGGYLPYFARVQLDCLLEIAHSGLVSLLVDVTKCMPHSPQPAQAP
ncbi:hypothetical protein WOLCODRAFT_159182 [Wolfiporia cocos MD-104 SS10]|uniref:Uncharacterized protein n=1 Tax=Wolfiporia cocos (strain MD-104) TaxID=742152 RepID=A0A2H3JCH8_WOLCO|nr:hypothetical protein WOLCODRAFT_159182 [Wolfiporia cocos MD-104 SS10]